MWGVHGFGWGVAMLLWMVTVWAAVLITAWVIFRNFGGPKHHVRH